MAYKWDTDPAPASVRSARKNPLPLVSDMIVPQPHRYANPGKLAAAIDPQHAQTAALDLIDDALVELMRDDNDEFDSLAVSLPPQEGKSLKISRRFPEWLLDRFPHLRIAIVSYEQDIALRWGRDIKMDIALNPCKTGQPKCPGCGGLHISIRPDSSAAGRWETPQGGGVYCVGVGGPLTSRTVDVLIVDDPVKDRAAAESQKIRDTTWDWWESVALTRFGPKTKVALVQTRWHEDDLAGRIFARPGPRKWKQLIIPAIATDKDPLGRKPGQELVSVRNRQPGYFRRLQATMSTYVFSGIYQQTPTAAEGNFFRRASFRYWRWMPPWPDGRRRIDCEGRTVTLADCWFFITMDFAASQKSSADYTVASVWAITLEGDLLLIDRRRARVPDHQHFKLAQPLIADWSVQQVFVESNWWSSTFVTDARDAGVPVALVNADNDKVTRAIPAAGRVHSGRAWWPAETSGCECGSCKDGKWLDEYCDELASFPQGTHDDQVDTLSYAARIQVNDWTRAPDVPRPGLHQSEQAIVAAITAATGGSGDDFNAFDIPY